MNHKDCGEHQYFDDIVSRCSHCADICEPLRGTKRECLLHCKDDFLAYYPQPTSAPVPTPSPVPATNGRPTIVLPILAVIVAICVVIIVIGLIVYFLTKNKKQNGVWKNRVLSGDCVARLKRPKRMKASMESAVVTGFNQQHILLLNPSPDSLSQLQSRSLMVPSSDLTSIPRYDSGIDANSQTPLLHSGRTELVASVQMESQPSGQVRLPANHEISSALPRSCVNVRGPMDTTSEQNASHLHEVQPTDNARKEERNSPHVSENHLVLDNTYSAHFSDTSYSNNRHDSHIAQPSDAGLSHLQSHVMIEGPANQQRDDISSRISNQDHGNNLAGMAEEQRNENSSIDEDADSAFGSPDSFPNSIESHGSSNNYSHPLASPSDIEPSRKAELEERGHGVYTNNSQCEESSEAVSSLHFSSVSGNESMMATGQIFNPSHHPSPMEECNASNLHSGSKLHYIEEETRDTYVEGAWQNRDEKGNEAGIAPLRTPECNLQNGDCSDSQNRVHGNGTHSGPPLLRPSSQRTRGDQSQWASMPTRSLHPQRGFSRDELVSRLGDIDKMDDIELGLTMNSLRSNHGNGISLSKV